MITSPSFGRPEIGSRVRTPSGAEALVIADDAEKDEVLVKWTNGAMVGEMSRFRAKLLRKTWADE